LLVGEEEENKQKKRMSRKRRETKSLDQPPEGGFSFPSLREEERPLPQRTKEKEMKKPEPGFSLGRKSP